MSRMLIVLSRSLIICLLRTLQEEKRRIVRKVYWRVLPFTFLLSILNYFDRYSKESNQGTEGEAWEELIVTSVGSLAALACGVYFHFVLRQQHMAKVITKCLCK